MQMESRNSFLPACDVSPENRGERPSCLGLHEGAGGAEPQRQARPPPAPRHRAGARPKAQDGRLRHPTAPGCSSTRLHLHRGDCELVTQMSCDPRFHLSLRGSRSQPQNLAQDFAIGMCKIWPQFFTQSSAKSGPSFCHRHLQNLTPVFVMHLKNMAPVLLQSFAEEQKAWPVEQRRMRQLGISHILISRFLFLL